MQSARWILNFDEGIFSPTFLLRIGCKIFCFFNFLILWEAVMMGVQLLNSLVAVLMGVALLWVDVVCFDFFLIGCFNCSMANGNIFICLYRNHL